MNNTFLQKLNQISKTKLIQVSFWNMIAVLVKMLTSLVSVKVVAVIIGPSGVALMGQLNNFSAILMTASTGGVNIGVTKYVAEYNGNIDRIKHFLSTSFKIVVTLSSLIGIVLIFGASYWSSKIFYTTEYRLVFIIFGFTIILYALNTLLLSIINGFKEFKKYVLVNICGSIIGLVFSVVLVLIWELKGALIAAVTFQSIVCFITIYLIYKSSWFDKKLFLGKFDFDAAKKLSHYSLMAIATALTVPVSQLIIRSFIVDNFSLGDAGIWEGLNRISAMYLMVITSSLGVYYLPRLAELKTRLELHNEIIKTYKLFIPLLLICSLSLFFLKDIVIKLLYSSEFYGMTSLFKFQLIGDFFKIVSWLLGYYLVAKSKTKLYIGTEIIFSLSLVLLSVYFINIFGLIGVTIAYAINYFIYFIFMIFIFRKLLFIRK